MTTFTSLKSLKSSVKDAYKETIITQHYNCSIEWIQKAWEEQRKNDPMCLCYEGKTFRAISLSINFACNCERYCEQKEHYVNGQQEWEGILKKSGIFQYHSRFTLKWESHGRCCWTDKQNAKQLKNYRDINKFCTWQSENNEPILFNIKTTLCILSFNLANQMMHKAWKCRILIRIC